MGIWVASFILAKPDYVFRRMVRVHQSPLQGNMNDKPINFEVNNDYSNEDYQQKDYQRFFKEGGDPDFSPQRNKAVLESTVQHNMKLFKQKYAEKTDDLKERAHATADYIYWLNKGKTGNAQRYFGRRELAKLRGVEVAREMQNITRIEVPGYYKSKGVFK